MDKSLLIVFVKNSKLGKVKTRLAKTIGDQSALKVYDNLLEITEQAINKINVNKRVYFSDEIDESKWLKAPKFVQEGVDLGMRMATAFEEGFKDGYEKIILIGSDLPDISAQIIQQGFDELANNEMVFGPAEDGGYYLVGMKKNHFSVFENKPWSQSNLLAITLEELKGESIDYSLLETLNDIDTIEDLEKSKLGHRYL